MIRLTLALLAVMFLTFTIAGADRGQVRYGLLAAESTPVAGQSISANPVTSNPEVEVTQAVYVPAAPVVDQPAAGDQMIAVNAPQAETTADPATEIGTLAEPEKLMLFVSVSSANVREGPSKDFAVIDKLTRGEAVTVVAASDTPDGWTLIQIEGDGLEGYISNALLADQP